MKCVLLINGKVELNFMWLPTWIGQNHQALKDMEKDLGPKLVGQALDEAAVHEIVLQYLCEKYPIKGLYDYLDGLKFVQTG